MENKTKAISLLTDPIATFLLSYKISPIWAGLVIYGIFFYYFVFKKEYKKKELSATDVLFGLIFFLILVLAIHGQIQIIKGEYVY